MEVIVTGASGFLGHALFHQLKAAGFDCLGVSRRSDLNELLSVLITAKALLGMFWYIALNQVIDQL